MKTLTKEILKPITKDEAVDMIIEGIKYFLKHEFKKTMVVLMLIFGCMLYVVIDYATSNKINIKDLKPLGEQTQFSISPQAFAQTKIGYGKESIVLDGKYYGEADTNFIIYKKKNSDELIIYNKIYKYGYSYEIPALGKFKNKN